MFRRKSLIMLVVMCAASGCANPKFVGRPDLNVVADGNLPPPEIVDLVPVTRKFFIGPKDQLSVDVFNIPELTKTVQVDSQGNIALPLIGTIQASGKTPQQLAAEVQKKLQDNFVKNPSVTVNLTEAGSQTVTIDGAVRSPGALPISGRTTLMVTIARAQGITEYAVQNYVVVFRKVNNQQMAALYDLRAIRRGIYPDPEIYANDIVLVGETNAPRVFRDILQTATVLVAPLVTILR